LEALSDVNTLRVVNSSGKSLLTPREEQVVALVADGLSNREAAHELGLSEHTIKKYLLRIFDKLGIRRASSWFSTLSRTGRIGRRNGCRAALEGTKKTSRCGTIAATQRESALDRFRAGDTQMEGYRFGSAAPGSGCSGYLYRAHRLS
jgi:DNA-binding CsgD family transcriptional regulator